MEEHAEDVEILILGSSHALDGINPEYIVFPSFNLANLGQTIKFDHFLFFKWADRCKKLKMVILPISYFSFFFDDIENYREVYYSIYMDYPTSYPTLEMLYYQPVKGKIKRSRNGNNIECSKNGWACRALTDKDTLLWNKDYVTKSLVHKQTAETWENIDSNYHRVCEMLTYCYKRNIRVVLVAPPHTLGYNRFLSKEQLAKTDSIISNLERLYDVEYLDYREDSRFYDDDFIDQSHLSEVGAEKFTKLLMQDLQVNNNQLEN